jgi:hypothetical protein
LKLPVPHSQNMVVVVVVVWLTGRSGVPADEFSHCLRA